MALSTGSGPKEWPAVLPACEGDQNLSHATQASRMCRLSTRRTGARCCSWAALCRCRPSRAASQRALSQTPRCMLLLGLMRLPSSVRPQQVNLCNPLPRYCLNLSSSTPALFTPQCTTSLISAASAARPPFSACLESGQIGMPRSLCEAR